MTLTGLVGCGGSGSDTQLSTSLASPSVSVQLTEGEVGKLSLTVRVDRGAISGMVPVFDYDSSAVVQTGSVDTSVANQYTANFATVADLSGGQHVGHIGFRLCAQPACDTVYSGGGQTFAYTINVTLADWSMFQRNAAHSGYVNASFEPAKFAKIWSWTQPYAVEDSTRAINPVVTNAGKVYVTHDGPSRQSTLYALNESDGSVGWSSVLNDTSEFIFAAPPAYDNGRLYVAVEDGTARSGFKVVDAGQGKVQFRIPTSTPPIFSYGPTIYGAGVVGVTGTALSSFSTKDGIQQWAAANGGYGPTAPGDENLANQGSYSLSAAAVDESYVYQYGYYPSFGLNVVDRTTGLPVANIVDPLLPLVSLGYTFGYMYSVPMLGSRGNVLQFSGGAFRAFNGASDSSVPFHGRRLVNYDVAKKSVAWASAKTYSTTPAVAKGVIYVARNDDTARAPLALDALSEADGHVLWSWVPPQNSGLFQGNVVATRNLIFVSTEKAVYAIDVNTHEQVWKYDQTGGWLAISSNSVLYVMPVIVYSTGDLVAIKLK